MQAIGEFGRSCHLPGSYQGPLVSALLGRDYPDAVKGNILAGGDQASRAHIVGALWGAQGGAAGVPDGWKRKVSRMAEIESLTDRLLAQRFDRA